MVVAVSLLLAAPVASGATRYASPTGIGPAATCPQGNPCNLQVAVGNAAVVAGDEIVLLPGTYTESNPINPDVGDQ